MPYRLEDELLEPPLRVGLNPPKVDFLSPKEDLLPPPLAVLRPLREAGLKVFIAIMVKGVSLDWLGEGWKAVQRTSEVTEKGLVGWDNEARGTELGRLHRVNNRHEYHSNKISTPNRPFSVTSSAFLGENKAY